MFSSFVLALIFSINGAVAQTASDATQELDEFIGDARSGMQVVDLGELESINFESVENIQKREQEERTEAYIEPNTKARKVFWEPVPFKAVLKKGSLLTDLTGEKKSRAPRALMVVARERQVGGTQSYIFDKSKTARFVTDTKNLIGITKDAEIWPDVDATVVHPEPEGRHSTDKGFWLQNDYQLHLEQTDGAYFARIYRGESNSASGSRLEVRSHVLTYLPVEFGLAINAGIGSWEDETIGSAAWRYVMFGPSLQWAFSHQEDGDWAITAQAMKSLLYDSEKQPEQHSYSATAYQFDLTRSYQTQLGFFTLGLGYRATSMSIKETTEYLDNTSDNRMFSTISFSLGYRHNWRAW
jgi:hypothetical protein